MIFTNKKSIIYLFDKHNNTITTMTNYKPNSINKARSQKRPGVVTGLCVFVLLVSLYHLFKTPPDDNRFMCSGYIDQPVPSLQIHPGSLKPADPENPSIKSISTISCRGRACVGRSWIDPGLGIMEGLLLGLESGVDSSPVFCCIVLDRFNLVIST